MRRRIGELPRNPLLTRENGGNYSADMQAELDTLESKLAQMLERYQAMREETLKLRQQVVTLESNNKLLFDRLAEARSRMEALLNKIPD
jgi:predicted  nucleic acid-binding Zn-ribbon protein